MRATELERLVAHLLGELVVAGQKLRRDCEVNCEIRGIKNDDLVRNLVTRTHGPEIQFIGLEGDGRDLAVAHELQDIRRLAGSTCGVRHQCPQGPMHRIVRVLDASSHAVQRSGEHFLAIGAEVGHDGGALGRPQLPGSGLEPEQLSKARRDPALVGDRNLGHVPDHALHARGNACARGRERHHRLAPAERDLGLPGAARDAQGLGVALVVIHDDLEVRDVGVLVARPRGGKLQGHEVELVRGDDAVDRPDAERHLIGKA
mmetsp:Transcript_39731/g.113907  ORF Transcript_39731/g.113907 Transcript_39731/m.113907 type:complete len:260 (+) Transcript_39731:51-830(+)